VSRQRDLVKIGKNQSERENDEGWKSHAHLLGKENCTLQGTNQKEKRLRRGPRKKSDCKPPEGIKKKTQRKPGPKRDERGHGTLWWKQNSGILQKAGGLVKDPKVTYSRLPKNRGWGGGIQEQRVGKLEKPSGKPSSEVKFL